MERFKEDLFRSVHNYSDKTRLRDNQTKLIKLSPTTLNLFLECPRCFWLYLNKNIRRPGPPVATIATGLDRVIKDYLNLYRVRNILPSFLEGRIPGKLMVDFPKKGWLDFTDAKSNSRLGGYLDECIKLNDNHYAVLDHKTRGSAPEGVHKAYQLQMDVYTFLLEANQYPTKRLAYIVYYIPKRIISGSDFQFEALIKELNTDPQRAGDVFYKAIETLRSDIPAASNDCEFCKWTATINIK